MPMSASDLWINDGKVGFFQAVEPGSPYVCRRVEGHQFVFAVQRYPFSDPFFSHIPAEIDERNLCVLHRKSS